MKEGSVIVDMAAGLAADGSGTASSEGNKLLS